MTEATLTLEQKEEIRKFLWKILGPTGGAAAILLFGLGWAINDWGRATAYNDALNTFQADFIDITREASTSAAVAQGARKDAEDARREIFRIRDDVKTSTITNIFAHAVAKLSTDPNFVTKVQEQLGYSIDLSNPTSKSWTQKKLSKINDPKILDSYDQTIFWHDGTKIHKQQGLCFLTKVSGKFEGGGEYVEVYIAKDNHWHFRGNSHQLDVAATVMCYKLKSSDQQ